MFFPEPDLSLVKYFLFQALNTFNRRIDVYKKVLGVSYVVFTPRHVLLDVK